MKIRENARHGPNLAARNVERDIDSRLLLDCALVCKPAGGWIRGIKIAAVPETRMAIRRHCRRGGLARLTLRGWCLKQARQSQGDDEPQGHNNPFHLFSLQIAVGGPADQPIVFPKTARVKLFASCQVTFLPATWPSLRATPRRET